MKAANPSHFVSKLTAHNFATEKIVGMRRGSQFTFTRLINNARVSSSIANSSINHTQKAPHPTEPLKNSGELQKNLGDDSGEIKAIAELMS